MLNILIAMIEKTYKTVIKNNRLANNYERAKFIYEIERSLS